MGGTISQPANQSRSGPGPKPGLPSLGNACPLPPSADIGPGRQSVGQAAQFCLAQMSRAAAAITTPVTNAAKQENSKRSSRILDRVASPAPTLAIGPSSGVDQLRLFKIDHPQSLVPWLGAGLGAAASRLRTSWTAASAWIRPMKAVTLLAAILLAFATAASAQQSTFRNANGQITGTVSTDSNGQRTFRGGSGRIRCPRLSKVQSVDRRMRLECGVGFRQLRTCRRIRPGQLCAKAKNRCAIARCAGSPTASAVIGGEIVNSGRGALS